METPPQPGVTCFECQASLNAHGHCLSCLLRGGLSEGALVDRPLAADPLPPSPDPAPTVYGDFAVSRRDDGTLWELGRGAMGVTYRAVDRVLHRAVALKVIRLDGPSASGDPAGRAALRERFLREARAAAALRHPHVAGIFQFGVDAGSGCPFYAMELVEGETLEARVRRAGPVDSNTTLEIAAQVAAALVAAAERGLIHRDLKPSNLMLEGKGGSARPEVKVIDFGLAKAATGSDEADLTHGGFVGTPAFASPEQFGRGTVDARTDIYSLGVSLWYALTGSLPAAESSFDGARLHPAHTPLPSEELRARGIPPNFAALLGAMLAPDPAGRPASARELARALEKCRAPGGRQGSWSGFGWTTRKPAVLALCGVLTAALVTGGIFRRLKNLSTAGGAPSASNPVPAPPPPFLVPEKSVAVLPFDNFSEDKDGAIFADGVQDEVLTDLAKVADLKVIGRSSVAQYKQADARRDPREIGRSLGVAHLVQGSVQRAGNQLRVTAQLIDARTAVQLWAEKYDRPLGDVFAVQSELARAIAGQLRAAISPQEQRAMSEAPTHDLAAYAAYLHALEFWNSFDVQDEALFQRTVDLLRVATDRDPEFARAFALTAYVQGLRYRLFAATPAQADLVRTLAETVARLRPGSGDAHLATGLYQFFVAHDYPAARGEAAAAVQLLPNEARARYLLGKVEESLEHWDAALAQLRGAAELDPDDPDAVNDYTALLAGAGQYAEAMSVLDGRIQSQAYALWARAYKSELLLAWQGDVPAARAELARLPADYDPQGVVTAQRLACDVCARDFAAAERDLATCRQEKIYGVPRDFFRGCLARYRGDAEAARAAFLAVRGPLEEAARSGPEPGRSLLYLATVDAALGRREDALAGRQAGLEKRLPEHNTEGPRMALLGARVLAWTGEQDEAIRALQSILNTPASPGYGLLRLDPAWDSLRADPRFRTLVSVPAPGS